MERKITYDLSKLHKFVDGLSSDLAVKVGIFGNRNSRREKGKSNAEIGALHEYGGTLPNGNKVPARSFLRMPLFQQSDQIINETSKDMASLALKGDWKSILTNLGIACERAISRAFLSRGFGSWKPNAPLTVKRKGSDSPLIDTRQLERAIASRVEKRAVA